MIIIMIMYYNYYYNNNNYYYNYNYNYLVSFFLNRKNVPSFGMDILEYLPSI